MSNRSTRAVLKMAIESLEFQTEQLRAVLNELNQQTADAEQCVQSEHQGQNTVIKLNPDDWIVVGKRRFWICRCNGAPFNSDSQKYCGACSASNPDVR